MNSDIAALERKLGYVTSQLAETRDELNLLKERFERHYHQTGTFAPDPKPVVKD